MIRTTKEHYISFILLQPSFLPFTSLLAVPVWSDFQSKLIGCCIVNLVLDMMIVKCSIEMAKNCF